jgi:hypothetical protein
LINGASLDTTTFAKGTSSLKLVAASNQTVSIPTSFTIDNSGVSFSFWFKTNSTGAYSRIFNFEQSSRYNAIQFLITANNKIGVSVFDAGNWYDYFDGYNDATMNNGVWRHITWTIAPNKTSSIYINGAFAYSFTLTAYPPLVARSLNSFGNNSFGNALYTGWIDDFRVYYGVLSATNAADLFSGAL